VLRELPWVLVAMRPRQWLKNSLVLAALIFARRWHDWHAVRQALAACAAFCLLSSFTYLLNDLRDAEEDRRHPEKRARPVAAGRLRPTTAASGALLLLAGGLVLAFAVNAATGAVGAVYAAITVAYQLGLKQQPILDVLAVASGYVLRAVAGATAIPVEISPWLLVCTVQLALFLALGKRRQELVRLGPQAANHRPALAHYSVYLLDQMIAVVTSSTVMSYALYTISERTVQMVGSTNMIYTLPFVIYGIFRYLFLMHQQGYGDAPDKLLLSDKPLLVDVLLYLVAVLTVLSLAQPAPPPRPPLPI
jgi:4-hydroxybenzoate polyprenyltransferase